MGSYSAVSLQHANAPDWFALGKTPVKSLGDPILAVTKEREREREREIDRQTDRQTDRRRSRHKVPGQCYRRIWQIWTYI